VRVRQDSVSADRVKPAYLLEGTQHNTGSPPAQPCSDPVKPVTTTNLHRLDAQDALYASQLGSSPKLSSPWVGVVMCVHPHCSSPSSAQLFARQHNNTLSITQVSAHSPKPSAASHHGNSTRVFILLATPTKSANRPMAGQVEQQQVCIKKAMFPA